MLTPGRYVGLAEEEDDFDFKERFTKLKSEFEEQLKEEHQLHERISQNLAKIDLNEKWFNIKILNQSNSTGLKRKFRKTYVILNDKYKTDKNSAK